MSHSLSVFLKFLVTYIISNRKAGLSTVCTLVLSIIINTIIILFVRYNIRQFALKLCIWQSQPKHLCI